MERLRSFDFDVWRMQYLQWMKNNRSRIMDFFHRADTDGDGKITRKEFIDGIVKSRASAFLFVIRCSSSLGFTLQFYHLLVIVWLLLICVLTLTYFLRCNMPVDTIL